MDMETIKKSIDNKFNEIENKVNILALESITTDNKEQIYGYKIKQLIENIQRLNNELPYAYVAGFFDGEGSIGANLNKARHPPSIRLRIIIVNTNLEILIKIKKIFKGEIYKRKKYIEHYKDKWDWEITNRDDMKFFLEKILPYSTVKRQQIEYGLKFLELTIISKTGRGHIVPEEEQKIRQFFSDKLKELKDEEYTNEEICSLNDQIKEMNVDKLQKTMMNF